MHTVSDIPRFWRQSLRDGDTCPVHDALCRVFGVPVDWVADQERRRGLWFSLAGRAVQDGKFSPTERMGVDFWNQLSPEDQQATRCSYSYMDVRVVLEDGLQKANQSIDNGFVDMPFTVGLREHMASLVRVLSAALFDLDTYFFGQVYGVPRGKTVSEGQVRSEMVRYSVEMEKLQGAAPAKPLTEEEIRSEFDHYYKDIGCDQFGGGDGSPAAAVAGSNSY